MKGKWRGVARMVSVFILLAVLFAYAMVQGGFVSWFLFYSVFVMVLSGFILGAFPLRLLRIERSIARRHLSRGETVKVQVNVYKKSRWPCFFIGIRDLVPPGLQIESYPGAFFFMLFSKEKTYSYLVKAINRGAYSYDHVYVESGDPFGFWKNEKSHTVNSDILVYPRIKPLPFTLKNGYSQKTETNYASFQRFSHEETLNFSSVREYAAGDRLSSIDWKVSARLGRLATKEFDTEEGVGFTILIDTRTNDRQRFEAAVEWAAATVNEIYENHSRLNIAVLGTDNLVTPVGKTRAHMGDIMKTLATIEPTSLEQVSFPRALTFLQTVIVIVPELHEKTWHDLKVVQQQGRDILVLYNEREAEHFQIKRLKIRSVAMPAEDGKERHS